MNQLLEVQKASFSYGDREILNDISFVVGKGEFVSLVGPNGSGKSTLMNLISGYRRCQEGMICLAGTPIGEYAPMARARVLAVVSQHENLDFPFTCMELVALGLYPRKSRFQRMTDGQLEEIRQVMELTDTLALAQTSISRISGGELQRVVLARALLQKPQLLLLDEAMSDFDIAIKIAMVKRLKTLVREQNISVLAINHDLANAYRFSDRILLLKEGRLLGDGSPDEVMTAPALARVFGVRAKVTPGEGFFVYDNLET